jgi:hypothetical protein
MQLRRRFSGGTRFVIPQEHVHSLFQTRRSTLGPRSPESRFVKLRAHPGDNSVNLRLVSRLEERAYPLKGGLRHRKDECSPFELAESRNRSCVCHQERGNIAMSGLMSRYLKGLPHEGEHTFMIALMLRNVSEIREIVGYTKHFSCLLAHCKGFLVGAPGALIVTAESR